MRRTPNRTPEKDWKPAFLKALARTCNVSVSAAKAGVGRRTVYSAREVDAAFAADWDEALEVAVGFMEEEARRRAFKGTLKPVYQKGLKVGEVREYSDTLAIFLLKAHKPDKYRDRHQFEHTGANGGPIQHEHSLTDRIDQYAAAFEGTADRSSEGSPSGDGAGEPLDSGQG